MSNAWSEATYLNDFYNVEVAVARNKRKDIRPSWWLDRYFSAPRLVGWEKLEFRYWDRGETLPLLYSKDCTDVHLLQRPNMQFESKQYGWPLMQVRDRIEPCDIEQFRIDTETGRPVPEEQRILLANVDRSNTLLDAWQNRFINDAISLLTTGAYDLQCDRAGGSLGTIDFGRADALQYMDLTGEDSSWDKPCSEPVETIKMVMNAMRDHKVNVGEIDVVYSELAWNTFRNHQDFILKQHNQDQFENQLSRDLAVTYNGIEFKRRTNGRINHYVDYSEYVDVNGEYQKVLQPGEIFIGAPQGFLGQRVFRNYNDFRDRFIPASSPLPVFMFPDLKRNDDFCEFREMGMKCWPFMYPQNVDGATIIKVVDESYVPCSQCQDCEE